MTVCCLSDIAQADKASGNILPSGCRVAGRPPALTTDGALLEEIPGPPGGPARRQPRARRRSAIDEALERCALGDVKTQVISSLSRGFRQRVGIAQAILAEPPVLVLDEPTVGLDPLQVREIRRLITGLAEGGVARRQTVVLSTHVLREVEALCQRVILIDRGRKALDAPIEELTADGRSLEDVFAQVVSADASGAEGMAS